MRSCSRSLAGVKVTVRLGFAGVLERVGAAVSKRPRLPQADRAAAAHSSAGAAQRRRPLRSMYRLKFPVTSATLIGRSLAHDLVRNPAPTLRGHALVQQLYLPGPNQIDPRPGSRLDEAANPNPPIFEGLRRDAGRLQRR